MAGKDTNTGAKRARELRAAAGLPAGPPVPCILTLVERDLGIPVVIAAFPSGVAGCCWRDAGHAVLWVNGTHPAVRQRFTLAHELGHLRCRHDAAVPVDTIETLAGRTTDSREIQANAFAAELLMPAAGIRGMVDGGATLDDVVRIAARYGTSTIAAFYRLNALGLAPAHERLAERIERREDAAVWQRLAPATTPDAIAAIDRAALPRFSPQLSGSALAALHAGAASIDQVAASTGCDAGVLATAAASVAV